ncbi:copper chaperone PCu(A)C [Streptomyces sp. RFCAC02]|uniref:copper chaperone PCu(A)C n=1 Tax=Streptomyces sp. RFCAC02 TaxID=2499143 RepID=UPI00101EB219|nr:copper chaperone PCu(A)C [Streptomyces sp. RFCAC02]
MTRAGRRAAASVLAGALAVALAGCGGGGGQDGDDAGDAPRLSVSGAYIPQPPTADVAGGYLTISNTGDTDDALTSVTSEAAESVEMHETEGTTMHRVDSLAVPAGGTLRLDRGGNHLMLMGLERRPDEGDTVPLELHFETSAPITLDVPVEAANHTGE